MGQNPWDETPASPLKVFFISPIGEEGTEDRRAADQALKYLVRRALPTPEYKVERADENSTPGAITPRLLASIIEADLIVADLSGYNPNVFYELAVAHGHHKKTVHIQRAGERAAFDVKDMRIVFYRLDDPEKLEQAVHDLRQQVKAAIDSDVTVETPLTATGRFLALDQSTDPAAEVAERLTAIEDLLSHRGGGRQNEMQPSDSVALTEWVEETVKLGIVPEERVRAISTEWTSKWFDDWVMKVASLAAEADLIGVMPKPDDPWASKQPDDPWASPAAKPQDEPPF